MKLRIKNVELRVIGLIFLGTALLIANLVLPTQVLAIVPDYSANVTSLVNYLKANQAADGSITGFGGETAWAVMGFAANGVDPHTVQNGGVSVVDFLQNNVPSSVTGWERDLLAVTAASENPFTFGGHNYVAQIESNASTNQIGSTTSLSDDFFGVLALLSAGPSANQGIISDSVDFIIANQNPDGGWSYAVANTSDPDDTAIAAQALQAAKSAGFSNAGLDNAINDGVSYLTSSQQVDGGWDAGFGTNAGSTAWSVLTILGDDSAVTDGLNFIVSKQDGSGGIDGGFGADTYTSANSLIAFGQKAFPVGIFDGTFQETENPNEEQPVATSSAKPEGQNNNTNGRVLAANIKDPGKVLAETLPNTGIESGLTNLVRPVLTDALAQNTINKLLIVGLLVLELGLVLWLLSGRLRRNALN